MLACDCCGRMVAHGQGHQHVTDDAFVCDECYYALLGVTPTDLCWTLGNGQRCWLAQGHEPPCSWSDEPARTARGPE